MCVVVVGLAGAATDLGQCKVDAERKTGVIESGFDLIYDLGALSEQLGASQKLGAYIL